MKSLLKQTVILPFIILSFSMRADKPNTEPIEWMNFATAVERATASPKPILVDVYTDWCGWCKRMDSSTFKDPAIVDYMQKNFYAVKLNAEGKDDISVRGRTFKYVSDGRRGHHELAAELLSGKMGYPSFVFLTSSLEIINVSPGYRPAEEMNMLLQYIADSSYTRISWDSFKVQQHPPK